MRPAQPLVLLAIALGATAVIAAVGWAPSFANPAATVRKLKGARSQSLLKFRLPKGWSSVTPYARNDDGTYAVVHEDRGQAHSLAHAA